ncbi:hypothetical protein ACWGCC_30435 [Streptomyces nigrescens]
MSTTQQHPQTQQPTEPPSGRALWRLTVFNVVAIVLLAGAGLLYVTWSHPSLSAPVQASAAVVAILVSVIVVIRRR